MKGQKEAVVEVFQSQGYLIPCYMKLCLTNAHFEQAVDLIVSGITSGQISYSKDRHHAYEVRKYVRSMIKNHMNRANELNGGSYKPTKKVEEVKEVGPELDVAVLPSSLASALKAYKVANVL